MWAFRPSTLPLRPPRISFPRDICPISDLDIKDAIAQESTQRSIPYLRQSIKDSILQDPFAPQKSTLWRDWMGKMPDISYERKLRSLMEKGMEPKMDTARMLKPEEVLSCR